MVGPVEPETKVKRRGLLVASRQRTCLLDVKTSELQAGQSKAYAFQVGPYTTTSTEGGSGVGSAGKPNNGFEDVQSLGRGHGSAGSATETAKVRAPIRFVGLKYLVR